MRKAVADAEPATAIRQKPIHAQLQVAVDLVVERFKPDQVILYGSAARGDMREDSDIDLLVLRPRRDGEPEYRQDHIELDGWASYIDIVVMEAEHAEQGRRRAGDMRQPALEDGRTLYARPGIDEVPTGPSYVWKDGMRTRVDTYEPEEYVTLLGQADEKLYTARMHRNMGERCQGIAGCIELTLKACLVAKGRSVRKHHNLNDLWKEAERHGTGFPIERDGQGLQELQQYLSGYRYRPPTEAESKKLHDRFRPVAEALYKYAVRECPGFARATRERVDEAAPPAPPALYKTGSTTIVDGPEYAPRPAAQESQANVALPDAAPNAPVGGRTTTPTGTDPDRADEGRNATARKDGPAGSSRSR